MKKRLFALVTLIVLVLTLCVPAFAADGVSMDMRTPVVSGHLVISDPNTGEQWNWDLPATDILVKRISGFNNASVQLQSEEISVDIGEYLLQTMTNTTDTEKVLHDDITLTAGLTYSIDAKNNTVSIYYAYGSAPNNGLYYAIDKAFYYANPAVFGPIEKHPTSTSWSYKTDSTPGNYVSSVAPYALLDCRITIAGMEYTYRDVSVICRLDWL